MIPGNFYNKDGDYLGTDSVNDGKVYIVTNQKEVDQLRKATKQGKDTQVGAVKSAIELPSVAARQEIGVDAVTRSNGKTTDDTKGGFHEEGGIIGRDQKGNELIIPAQPGAVSDPLTQGKASIDTFNAANPAQMQNLASVDFTYHVHPSGELDTTPKAPLGTTVIGGSTSSRNFDQEPSPGDITFAQQLSGSTHIVVGARDKNVYIYNGSGVRVKISLDNFNKLR